MEGFDISFKTNILEWIPAPLLLRLTGSSFYGDFPTFDEASKAS